MRLKFFKLFILVTTLMTNSYIMGEDIVVPVGDDVITLCADPDPTDADWPDGYPEWYENGFWMDFDNPVYLFDPSVADYYYIEAVCGTSSKGILITVVTIDKILDNGSGSFQESQTENGSYITYVQKDSQRQLKATPDPDSTWPTGYPKWFVDGQLKGSGETYTFQSDTTGMHTVSAQACACSAGLCNTAGHRKDIKVYVGELKLYVETKTGQNNDGSFVSLTECMEGRTLTYTAKLEGVTNNPSKTFTFYFQTPSITDWNANEVSTANSVNYTVVAGNVADSPNQANHMFTTPIHVSVKINNIEYFESEVMNINVYELWIDYFKDAATGKQWKVCVGNNISYNAIASNDCDDWNWDMPEGIPDAWNPTGGNAKSGAVMKIPYSDLPRASNSWFGDTYGEVEVSCNDGEDNFHRKYSTDQRGSYVKADVFFPPDVNVNGEAPSTALPPCWFVFWKDGVVVNGISAFAYDHTQYWGLYNGNLYLGRFCRGTGNARLSIYNINGTFARYIHTPRVKHLDQVAGTIVHENYHKFVATTWNWAGPSDADGLPDGEENTPTSHNGVAFIVSDPGKVNSLGFPDYPGEYEDQEVRCRIVETDNPATTYPNKDWSCTNDNPRW